MTEQTLDKGGGEKWAAQLRKGSLELAVLALLWEQPRYGLELLGALNAADLPVGEGTLYPILNRLRGDGLLASDWRQEGTGNPRKYYDLTAEGRARTLAMAMDWTRFAHTMDQFINRIPVEGSQP